MIGKGMIYNYLKERCKLLKPCQRLSLESILCKFESHELDRLVIELHFTTKIAVSREV